MSQKILNKRSSVVVDGNPKLPTAEQMEYGEIAVNFAAGYETLSILNDSGIVETFSSDTVRHREMGAFSASVISEIEANEYTTALAVTDLNERISSLSGLTPSGLTEHIENTTIHVTQENKNTWNGKQNAISDLSTIRNNATSGASAYTGLTAHTANTQLHLPSVTSSDNGKTLQVVNGVWSLSEPIQLYSGGADPDPSIGNDGDLYLQTE
jgi:hypothetical protein